MQDDLDALFGAPPSTHDAPRASRRQRLSRRATSKPEQQETGPEQREAHSQQQPQQPPLTLDPAAQLALRMMTPIPTYSGKGRRLFFVSHDSADVIRQAMVLER